MSFKKKDFDLLDKTILGRAIFKPPTKISSSLDNEARFVHVVSGKSRLCSAGKPLELSSGDSVIMKCEKFVNNWYKNEGGTINEVIVFQVYPDILKYVYDNQLPDIFSVKEQVVPSPVEKLEASQMITTYIESLRFYLDNPALVSEELLKIKMRELILVLVNSDSTNKIRSILSNLFQPHEYEFREIVHANLFEDLKIEDLAFFAGLSLSSFKRKFKTVFDTSPGVYIKTRRLEKAKRLLEKTSLRVSEIAFDCGFNDVGYFSKSFASQYSCSPSGYRKTI